MFIINQDRDNIVQFNGEFHTMPVVYDGSLMGFNLYTNLHMLGTFESLAEALIEMKHIKECEDKFYLVSGHSDWEQWEMIKESMLEDEVF